MLQFSGNQQAHRAYAHSWLQAAARGLFHKVNWSVSFMSKNRWPRLTMQMAITAVHELVSKLGVKSLTDMNY